MSSELEETIEQLRKQQSPSSKVIIKYLRLVRELKTTDPEGVARYGGLLLNSSTSRSSVSEEELWLLHEQVSVAALSIGQVEFAAQLIRAVAKKFPGSQRANRLKGLYWEAQGNLGDAEQIYKDMLEQQPACEIAHKRMAALEKTRGNYQAAADTLRRYLDTWANDREAWEELAELYVQLNSYKQAQFCYEELLTMAPGHLPFLIRLADVLYTLGGNANLKAARAYYSKAVEVSGGSNARALWGVTACCANITEKVTLQDSLTRAVMELPGLASDALQQLYKEQSPGKLSVVQAVLQDSLGQA